MKKFWITALTLTLSSLAWAQLEFRAIQLPDPDERVTAIHCLSVNSCLVATDAGSSNDGGSIYLSDGQKITATLLKGESKLAESVGTLGTLGFMGFTQVGDRLVALVNGASGAFISAKGDPTQATSWTAIKMGVTEGSSGFGLNQQMGIGFKDGRWVHFIQSTIFESSDTPSPGALWLGVWSPISPSIPPNFSDLKRADPKLCEADPGVPWSPKLTQPAYVAPDLSVIVYTAGTRNQRGSVNPGVCISVDGGKRFHNVAFAGLDGEIGPLGVKCINSNRCYAYGGMDYSPESVYIYYTNDAQKGVASSWTKAKLPTLRENTKFRGIGFAPDGNAGWAIATVDGAGPAFFSTTDGGASWQDVSSSIRALASNRMHAVYAFDATHVWIGGEKGLLLTSGK